LDIKAENLADKLYYTTKNSVIYACHILGPNTRYI